MLTNSVTDLGLLKAFSHWGSESAERAAEPLNSLRISGTEHSGDPGAARCSVRTTPRGSRCRKSRDFFIVNARKIAINCLMSANKRRFRF